MKLNEFRSLLKKVESGEIEKVEINGHVIDKVEAKRLLYGYKIIIKDKKKYKINYKNFLEYIQGKIYKGV